MANQRSPKSTDRRYFWRSTGARDIVWIPKRNANKLRRRVLHDDFEDQNPPAEASESPQAEEIPSGAAVTISPILASPGNLPGSAPIWPGVYHGSEGMPC